MAELKIERWLPMPPFMGPPLPRFWNFYWPWLEGYTFYVINPPPEAAKWRIGLFSESNNVASLYKDEGVSTPIKEPVTVNWKWLQKKISLSLGATADLQKISFWFDTGDFKDNRATGPVILKAGKASVLDWSSGQFEYNIDSPPYIPLPQAYTKEPTPPPIPPSHQADRFLISLKNIPPGEITGWYLDLQAYPGGTIIGAGTGSPDYSRNIPDIGFSKGQLQPEATFRVTDNTASVPNVSVVLWGMPEIIGETVRPILRDTQKNLGAYTFRFGQKYVLDHGEGKIELG